MMQVLIRLNSIAKVKDFVDIASGYNLDLDLVRGRYTIDAKSIMGVFSMDLSKDITLVIHDDTTNPDVLRLIDELKTFIVE